MVSFAGPEREIASLIPLTAIRIAARLDIKFPNLVKGMRLEGLRVLGEPVAYANRYAEQGIDEMFYQDIVASLYGRNTATELIAATARELFVPLTVGGGLQSVEDIDSVLRAGADKVCLNTAAINDPALITRAAEIFGSQCVVIAIEVIRQSNNECLVFTDNGRVATGREPVAWSKECVDLGAGEVLVTSVDRDGSRRGPDLDLIGSVRAAVNVPLIAHGGIATASDAVHVAATGADCLAIASALHYGHETVQTLRAALASAGFEVRT